jgi:hypothetical protein
MMWALISLRGGPSQSSAELQSGLRRRTAFSVIVAPLRSSGERFARNRFWITTVSNVLATMGAQGLRNNVQEIRVRMYVVDWLVQSPMSNPKLRR